MASWTVAHYQRGGMRHTYLVVRYRQLGVLRQLCFASPEWLTQAGMCPGTYRDVPASSGVTTTARGHHVSLCYAPAMTEKRLAGILDKLNTMLSEWRESRHRPHDNIDAWLRTRRWTVSEAGHTSNSLEDWALARPYGLHDMLDSEVRKLLAHGRVELMKGADPEQAAEFERALRRDRDRLRKARDRADVLKTDPRWRIEELNSGPLRKLSMLRMTDPAGHFIGIVR